MQQKEVAWWDGDCSSSKAMVCTPGLLLFSLRGQNTRVELGRGFVVLTVMIPESCLLAHKQGAMEHVIPFLLPHVPDDTPL